MCIDSYSIYKLVPDPGQKGGLESVEVQNSFLYLQGHIETFPKTNIYSLPRPRLGTESLSKEEGIHGTSITSVPGDRGCVLGGGAPGGVVGVLDGCEEYERVRLIRSGS